MRRRVLAGKIVAGIAGLAASVLTAGSGAAQTGAPPAYAGALPPAAEADILFKRLLVRPNDLDSSFRYAQIQTALGDYEAAVGALERILFYNPNLSRVKLELGLLYFKLGSYEMARSYFTGAIESPDTPADVRARVEGFLREIDRRLSDSQFSVNASAGLRYQSNANAGPDGALVRAVGQDATLSQQFTRRSDLNAFGVVQLRHVYDFQNQNGDTWETNAVAYYARQFRVTRLNLGLVEVDTGPRLGLGEAGEWSVRPYAIGTFVTLADRPYLLGGGGGASLRWRAPFGVTFEPGAEVRSRNFNNTAPYPNAGQQTGYLTTAYFIANAPIPELTDVRAVGRLFFTRAHTMYRPYAYDQVGFDVAFPWEFAAPDFVPSGGRRWTLSPFTSYYNTHYRQADPIVDPLRGRYDREWRAGATLDMPIYEWLGLAVQVQYAKTSSTLPNFRNSNFTVSAAPTFRF